MTFWLILGICAFLTTLIYLLLRRGRDKVHISEQEHERLVQKLAQQVEQHYKRQQSLAPEQRQRLTIERKIGEAHSSRSQPYKENTFKVNVSQLNHVVRLH